MARRSMVKSGRAHSGGVRGCSYNGCSCHNSKEQRRKGKRSAKRAEERQWRREEGQ